MAKGIKKGVKMTNVKEKNEPSTVEPIINVDMEKAKNMVRDGIRSARHPMLSSLDIDFQRALEQNSNTHHIVARKQSLRDLPSHPDIDSAKDTEELRNVMINVVAPILASNT